MELFECHICGKKSPYEDDLEICEKCGEVVCIECSEIVERLTICDECRRREENYDDIEDGWGDGW